MGKSNQIAELLSERIRNADYSVTRLPGARKLATELGVSYLTALHALNQLHDQGVIRRQSNGRFAVAQPSREEKRLNIAFLTGHDSYRLWENSTREVAQELGIGYRQISYSHKDDPVIADVINGDFDLVFIIHPIHESRFVEQLIVRNHRKVVTLFEDMTDCGVRCLDGPPPVEVRRLVDYLYEFGHRKFASYTLFPCGNSATQKIAVWNDAVESLGLHSESFLADEVQSSLYPARPAYDGANWLESSNRPTAVFCSSVDIAIGVIRRCNDLGITVGRELSVCSFGKPELASMYIPSITVIDRPSPKPEIEAILREAQLKDSERSERLMYRSGMGKVIYGESTGRVVDQPKDCYPKTGNYTNNQQGMEK